MSLGLPSQAREELELAGGIALYDVTRAVPRTKRRRKTSRPKGQAIERIYVHHSGALGARGYKGALNASRYVTGHRGFPGVPYHFWLPYHDDRDHLGRIPVLRLAEDSYRAWHSGALANDHGIGVALQGDLTKSGPSDVQLEALEALLPWLIQRHGLRASMPLALSWHAEAGKFGGRSKPTCPGAPAIEWLSEYRQRAA